MREVTKTNDIAVLIRAKEVARTLRELSVRFREILIDQEVIKNVTLKATLETLNFDYLTEMDEVRDILNHVLG